MVVVNCADVVAASVGITVVVGNSVAVVAVNSDSVAEVVAVG